MQNLTKRSNWHFVLPRKTRCFSFNYIGEQKPLLVQRDLKLWSRGQVCRSIHPVSYRALNQMHKEYRTVRSLLLRSGLGNKSNLTQLEGARNLSTTSSNADKASTGGGSSTDPPSKDPAKPPKKNNNNEKYNTMLWSLMSWSLFIWFCSILVSYFLSSQQHRAEALVVSWNEFLYNMLAKGEVEAVIVKPDYDVVTIILHDNAIVNGQRVMYRRYQMVVADPMKFEEKLRAAEHSLGIKTDDSVVVLYERKSDSAGRILDLLIPGLLLLSFLRSRKGRGRFSIDILSQMKRAKFTLVDPLTGKGKGVRFDDVAGLKEAKIEVMEFVDYLKHPEHYKVLGAKVPKGALLLGPPGCGKTLLAKAVATEANVPFLSMNGSEFIEMIGGLGAARVRDLFTEAKKRTPCIIYIDEIDAIGKKRSGVGGSEMSGTSGEGEQTLNQLLVEMDGMISKEGVVVLASTNRADVLDKALLRPGRFDRHILIDLPTLEERRQIFDQYLKGIALEDKPSTYSKRLAYLTPGLSGADIANVCNEAALHAARFKKKVVDVGDLSYAVDRLVGGNEKKDHAMSPFEKRMVAYHEAGHALVGWLLEHTDALLKVSIIPRTNLALSFAQYTPTDQKLYSKEQLFERMCMALGGRVAESIIFNKITTRAEKDLTKVTKMAYSQIRHYGMNDSIGLVSFDEEQTTEQSRKPYSKMLGNLIDEEARRLIARAYKRTEKLLLANKDKLALFAETLLKKETLHYEDVVKLLGPPLFEKKRFVESAEFESSVKDVDPSVTSEPAQV